jgi:hypothetical protein
MLLVAAPAMKEISFYIVDTICCSISFINKKQFLVQKTTNPTNLQAAWVIQNTVPLSLFN